MTLLCRPLGWLAIFSHLKGQKVYFHNVDCCIFCWLYCWARCWILQDMDIMEASCIFCVKDGILEQQRQSKICILTVITFGILILTIKCEFLFTVSFIKYRRDILRETSPDIHSVEKVPVHISLTRYFGYCSFLYIPDNKDTTFDRLPKNHLIILNPCYLQIYPTGLNLGRTCKLAVTHFILTWTWLYIPQDFPLLFIIIFLWYSTPADCGNTNASARWERIQIQWNDGCFLQCVTRWDTTTMYAPVCPPSCCQCSHHNYDRGRTFDNTL